MQHQYTVNFGKMNLLIWALIIVPAAPMFVFVAIVLQFHELNSIVLFSGIIATMAVSLALLFWLIKTRISMEAVITPTDEGLEVELARTNIFFRQKHVFIPLSNIRNFSLNYDARSGQEFLVLRLVRGANLQITAAKHMPDDLGELHGALAVQRNRYNSNPALKPTVPIGNKSFFESTFSRLLTGAIIMGTILVTINLLVGADALPLYKVIGWYAIAGVWLINVWYAKHRSNQNKG